MSDDDKPDQGKPGLGRRKFLVAAGIAGASAAGVAAWRLRDKPVPPIQVRLDPAVDVGFYRRLGRTGLRVSAVSIGGGGLGDPGLIERAVDSGINYIDTSICYGNSELVIGEALKRRPDLRDKLIITTKWDATQDMPKARILESLDRSLERLGVKRVDIMMIHWLGGGHVRGDNGFNRLDNSALYEAMDEARKSGKARYFGASSHHANRSAILQHAIDKGSLDVLLVKMNVLDFESAQIPELLAKAKKHDVGVVAMKTQPKGGELPAGFSDSKWSVYQANLRWALQHDVATVVHSDIGKDASAQDAAIEAGRAKLSARDTELLERYATALSPSYCRGCDDLCGAACPEQIDIAHVLQFHMYERQYGWHERARRHYQALAPERRWAERCADCDACSEACPYGVDAAARVRQSKRLLGASSVFRSI